MTHGGLSGIASGHPDAFSCGVGAYGAVFLNEVCASWLGFVLLVVWLYSRPSWSGTHFQVLTIKGEAGLPNADTRTSAKTA